jgi:hypothetical protein
VATMSAVRKQRWGPLRTSPDGPTPPPRRCGGRDLVGDPHSSPTSPRTAGGRGACWPSAWHRPREHLGNGLYAISDWHCLDRVVEVGAASISSLASRASLKLIC